MQAVAISSAVVCAFPPNGGHVEVAQFLGYSANFSIRLMPDRFVSLEQPAIFEQALSAKLCIQGASLSAQKGGG